MLRVKAIAPLRLSDAELERRQARYDRLGHLTCQVTLVNLVGTDAPERLDSPEQVARSEELTIAEIERTDPRAFDVVVPDCVLDPGVGTWLGAVGSSRATSSSVVSGAGSGSGAEHHGSTPVPVVGILRLVGSYLASVGRCFAAVARNQVIADTLAATVDRYGLGAWLTGVYVLDVDFCLVADGPSWAEALRPLERQLLADGVETLFNGCSAVDIEADALGPITVVDPTALALRLLSVAPAVLGPSRRDVR